MRCFTIALCVLSFLSIVYTAFAQPPDFIVKFPKEVDACEHVFKLDSQCWKVVRCHRWHAMISQKCGKDQDDLINELDIKPTKVIDRRNLPKP